MNKISKTEMIWSQNFNLKYFKLEVEIDNEKKIIDATVSDLETDKPSGEVDNVAVESDGVQLGVIHKNIIYVAIDSNGDGKIDKDDFSWKVLELVRSHFFGEKNN